MIDHYENPRNVGKLDATKNNVGTGLVGAPACGDVMKLQVRHVTSFHLLSFDTFTLTKYNLRWQPLKPEVELQNHKVR